jgi:hypothetical protein
VTELEDGLLVGVGEHRRQRHQGQSTVVGTAVVQTLQTLRDADADAGQVARRGDVMDERTGVGVVLAPSAFAPRVDDADPGLVEVRDLAAVVGEDVARAIAGRNDDCTLASPSPLREDVHSKLLLTGHRRPGDEDAGPRFDRRKLIDV